MFPIDFRNMPMNGNEVKFTVQWIELFAFDKEALGVGGWGAVSWIVSLSHIIIAVSTSITDVNATWIPVGVSRSTKCDEILRQQIIKWIEWKRMDEREEKCSRMHFVVGTSPISFLHLIQSASEQNTVPKRATQSADKLHIVPKIEKKATAWKKNVKFIAVCLLKKIHFDCLLLVGYTAVTATRRTGQDKRIQWNYTRHMKQTSDARKHWIPCTISRATIQILRC